MLIESFIYTISQFFLKYLAQHQLCQQSPLGILDKPQKWFVVGPFFPESRKPLTHCRNVASLSLFCRYYCGGWVNWLNWFHFIILNGGLLVILIDCMIFLLPFLDVIRMAIQQSLSSRSYTLEFSVYRMLSF